MHHIHLINNNRMHKNSNYSDENCENGIDIHWAAGQPNNRPDQKQDYNNLLELTHHNRKYYQFYFRVA